MIKAFKKHPRVFAAAWKLALLGSIAGGLLTFQNCTQMPEGTEDQNTKLSEDMDFAYDTTIDQISYMSCPRIATAQKQPTDASMYYTFRVGAYRFGGIKLSDTFFSTYAKKTPERLADLLVNSKANSHTVLQLAVRQVGALNSLVTGPGTQAAGMDFSNLFVALGSNEVNANFITVGRDETTGLATGKRVRYLRDGTGNGAHVEGTLNFGSNAALQDDLRVKYLGSGAALLSLTYLEPTASGGGSNNSTPDVDVRNQGTVFPDKFPSNAGLAYGTGYQLTFSQPVGYGTPKGLPQYNASAQQTGIELLPYPSNWLNGVVERNLLTGAQGSASAWVCPTSLKFKVIRPGDENDATNPSGVCPRVADLDVNTNMEFAIARNAFKTEDWYINFASKCIVPKRSGGANSCYGGIGNTGAGVSYVQYDIANSNGCDPNSNETTNANLSRSCLAWASVCYRVSQ
jgi:hypothetical protein